MPAQLDRQVEHFHIGFIDQPLELLRESLTGRALPCIGPSEPAPARWPPGRARADGGTANLTSYSVRRRARTWNRANNLRNKSQP